ncbi:MULTISPECIES: UxaA family hydrolase [unclassified Sphingopyxis]|uniref:UxaA family hydrolase n=1 Tax=unclassified Sphingopyxis TaxID=2614943 RepID=UPI0006C2E1C9|nr:MULTISPECIES: altronate dehydratase family protein [unclassified Sphingopyxis]USI76967.1 altronate dehydratase family protein [Sphingopyxis sp. USTB-05]GAO80587.1 altronate dehydratase [Sphingopyxis sp. C-1]
MTGNIATRAIRVHDADNVATAIADIAAGERLFADSPVRASVDLGRGHKVAIEPIARGAAVIKYGFPIGTATTDIAPGEHVHSHNLATALSGDGDYLYAPDAGEAAQPGKTAPTFRGYVRPDGRVGTRNEIWILPTVGCVGNLAARVARIAGERHAGRVDGVHAFKHPFGCSQLGDDLGHTRALLAALAQHPNAGGVLIVGLGCESNQLGALLDLIPAERRAHIRTLSAQAVEDDEEACLESIDALVDGCADTPRSDVPLSKLVLGVKCGGSDGLSGLTANPLVGRMADAVAGAGGKVVLTEIPEIFGAEQLLMDRAVSQEIFDETVALVRDFKDYFIRNGEPVSENPSPGNIAGGITTLEEKSLGAVQKGGKVPVVDVRRYGGEATLPGLTLLEAPGNDAVSSTALTAAGATIILFTTGRGTPLGFPAPTLKIASNSALAQRKAGWIDFDAGTVLDAGFDSAADALLGLIAATASGAATRAEKNEERDIAIWKSGVTL